MQEAKNFTVYIIAVAVFILLMGYMAQRCEQGRFDNSQKEREQSFMLEAELEQIKSNHELERARIEGEYKIKTLDRMIELDNRGLLKDVDIQKIEKVKIKDGFDVQEFIGEGKD